MNIWGGGRVVRVAWHVPSSHCGVADVNTISDSICLVEQDTILMITTQVSKLPVLTQDFYTYFIDSLNLLLDCRHTFFSLPLNYK